LKLNVLGLISAIIAFISIFLPWYSFTYIVTFNFNLLDFANLAGLLAGVPGTEALQTWFIWVALALLVIGGLLGLLASFIIGGKGKSLLAVGGILVLLSPIIFAGGLASIGFPLFGSISADLVSISFFISFGFFLAFVAAILMLISTRKHPTEAGAVPLAPAAPPPPQ